VDIIKQLAPKGKVVLALFFKMVKKKVVKVKKTKHKPINNTRKTVQNDFMEDSSGFNEENDVEPEDIEFYQTTDRSLEFLTKLTSDSHS
jgi:hypothetical protein